MKLRSGVALVAVIAAALGAAAALIETRFSPFQMTLWRAIWPFAMGLFSLLCAQVLMRRRLSLPKVSPWAVIVAAFVLCLLVGWISGAAWPNSGDEYGYSYLADTLLHGRLWNPAPPDAPLFATWHIPTIDGKTFAYYAPGWPAVIAIFKSIGLEQLASPVMTALMGYALLRTLRLLEVSAGLQAVGLAMILFSPFILFNGASLYPHAATGALVALIAWTRLSDDARPAVWKPLLIGVFFSILLQIRYETCAEVAAVYVIERFCLRRSKALPELVFTGIGAIPSILFLLYYNYDITGHALLLPYSWANPYYHLGLWGFGDDGQHSPDRGLLHAAIWSGELAEYAGLALIPPYVLALGVKWRRGTLRFFDVLLPVAIAFYFLQPDNGGHRYGPRYWFFGWPPVILTIMSGLRGDRERTDGERIAAYAWTSFAYCAGSLVVLCLVTRVYIDARREVYATAPPSEPAVVLVPKRPFIGWRWQSLPIYMYPEDFTRNDMDYAAPVLYGNGTAPNAVALACRMPGRHVYEWDGLGRYTEQKCS